MSFRIDNINYDLQPDHSFYTTADYYYTNQPTYRAQFRIPGYQYDYYLDLAAKIQAPYLAGNQNADGTVKQPGDAGYTTTPDVPDVARVIHDFYYPIYMNPPSTTVDPVSGTAPGLV